MIIPIIPSDIEESFLEVNTLSPSLYTQMKDGCLYRRLLHKSANEKTRGMGISLLYPAGPAAIYGSITHLMFERRMKGLIPDVETFEKMWDTEVNKINDTYSKMYPMFFLKNDYSKMFEVETIVMRMNPCMSEKGSTKCQSLNNSLFERPYKIPNLLYGKIDRISYLNCVEIIDYKTGNIYDENHQIKQDYIDQLNLYLLMYEYVEERTVDKLTIIDKTGTEISIPIVEDKQALLHDVEKVINRINHTVKSGTCADLADPSEQNCAFCECRHLCSKYWESSFLPESFKRGKVIGNGARFVTLELGNGSTIRISGIEKMNIPLSEFYIGRQLMFIDVMPSQYSINQYIITKNSLVFEYSDISDPYAKYYSNYLPELHNFVRYALEKGYTISEEGGFYLLDDDGMIVAEAGLGIEEKKIVVDAYTDSEDEFINRGYTVLNSTDFDQYVNIID